MILNKKRCVLLSAVFSACLSFSFGAASSDRELVVHSFTPTLATAQLPSKEEMASLITFLNPHESSTTPSEMDVMIWENCNQELIKLYEELSFLFCNKKKLKNHEKKVRSLLDTVTRSVGVVNSLYETKVGISCGAIEGVKYPTKAQCREYMLTTGKPYFETWNKLTNSYMAILNSLGLNDPAKTTDVIKGVHHNLGYIKTSDGYFLYITLNNRIISSSHLPFYTNSSPYQFYPLFGVNGDPIQSSGFFMQEVVRSYGIGVPTKFVKITGVSGAKASSPFFSTQQSIFTTFSGVWEFADITDISSDGNKMGFISIPTTPLETKIAQITLIESLQEDLLSDDPQKASSASLYLKYIEDKTGQTVDEYKTIIEEQVLSEYERQIQAEQEERQKMVASSSVPAARRGNKKRGGARPSTSKAVCVKADTADTQEVKRAKAQELFKKYKVESKLKYRKLMELINLVRSEKDLDMSRLQDLSVRGSHISFHFNEGQGATIVIPHGTHDSVRPNAINNFLSAFIGATFASKESS